jgi:hypothetical protein
MRESTMESFEYLLELSMTLTDGQADPDALREAYEALVAIDAERGRCTTIWHEQSGRELSRQGLAKQ